MAGRGSRCDFMHSLSRPHYPSLEFILDALCLLRGEEDISFVVYGLFVQNVPKWHLVGVCDNHDTHAALHPVQCARAIDGRDGANASKTCDL